MSEGTGLEVAIIGMAGRFPQARTLEEFWSNLEGGRDCIARFSDQDLLDAGLARSELARTERIRAFGRLEDVELVDAVLLGLSPREAELMDPQHRVLLECAWEALERAACDPEQLTDVPVGVFVGCGSNSYFVRNVLPNARWIDSLGGFQTGFGHEKDHLAPLLAFKLGLEGPSVTVQSACSTSLAAVHMACQSLLSGECDIALAGGVSIDVTQDEGYVARGDGVLSRQGCSRAFDAGADGMVPGNGAGLVVLRRLEEALESGDTIRAVVKGSAVGNDGSRRAGYGAPRTDGQARVIRAAQMMAEVEASTLQYVEAHGSSTLLGDSVELGALAQAFRATTQRQRFCALGSVKNNVGHLGAASGIAGLIKTVLALGRRKIPPSLHFETPNREFDFDSSPFFVPIELTDWPAGDGPRRAGVSSLGLGGTNVHVLVEESPEPEPSGPGNPLELLVWSAATPSALETVTERLRQRLATVPDEALADLAHTLRAGRRCLEHRRGLVCRNRAEALETLARRPLPDFPESWAEEGRELVEAGRLWLSGSEVCWSDFFAGEKRRKTDLPIYPFERRRYWLEPASATDPDPAAEPSAPDRPVHARPLDDASYVEPRNEIERELAAIFQELLGVDRVGAEDSFFKLGGNSILGLEVISRVRRTWDVELPLAELFEIPTVASLAHGITKVREQRTQDGKPGLLEDLDNLSDDDMDAMLAELMAEGDER